MRVGVPSEIKKNEHRVGLTPTAARSSELPAIIGHADWSFGTASGLTRGESARL